ncbi:MAG: Cof-type HAD-IIB family hydrolase [Eubacterium sp.]|nr:Cof-type HAD-IIB family hydrolase [Eubacterium sp.]
MEIKREILLIGADLDGTLLTDGKTLCDGAAETIKKARQKGIYFVPVTGRPFKGIPECVRSIEDIEYVICANGAQIIDAKTQESVYSCAMSNEKSTELFFLLKDAGCVFEPFCGGVCYTEQEIFDSYIEYFRGSPVEEYLISTRVICDSVEELFTKKGMCADEFFVSCRSREERDKISAVIDTVSGVQYWFFDEKYIEITHEKCDKGETLRALCKMLDIPVEKTMAFGDGDNDMSFIKAAGISVAMKNANERIKEKADIIADTNNNNGVCKIIAKLL